MSHNDELSQVLADQRQTLEELIAALRELATLHRAGVSVGSPSAGVYQQSSAPMWVCVLLVAVTMAYTVAKDDNRTDAVVQQAAQIAVLSRKVDRLEDYETTAYMLFPDFRKAIEADIQKRNLEQ